MVWGWWGRVPTWHSGCPHIEGSSHRPLARDHAVGAAEAKAAAYHMLSGLRECGRHREVGRQGLHPHFGTSCSEVPVTLVVPSPAQAGCPGTS